MSVVCGCTLIEYPSGLVEVYVDFSDGSTCTSYLGTERSAASRAHIEALLQMKSWQTHRAQLEAMPATPNPTPANGEAE